MSTNHSSPAMLVVTVFVYGASAVVALTSLGGLLSWLLS